MYNIKLNSSKAAIFIAIILLTMTISGCVGPRGWPGATVEGDSVIVATMDGKIIALDSKGVKQWHWPPEDEDTEVVDRVFSCDMGCGGDRFSGGAFYGAPVQAGDIVYVAAYKGTVFAIDTQNASSDGGRHTLWSYDTGGQQMFGLTYADGIIFAGCSNGKLYALDASKEGTPIWREPFDTGAKIMTIPVVHDRVVYFGSMDHKLYAVNIDTGKLVDGWEKPFETKGGIKASPLVVNGVIYVGSLDSKFYAVDASTGKEKWVFKEADGWFFSKATYDNGSIYVGNLDHNIYAINADDGKQKWSRSLGDPISSALVISNGIIVVVTELGHIYGLDPNKDGADIWTSERLEPHTKVHAPLSSSNGKVYINAQNNRLYTVNSEDGTLDRYKGIKLND